MEFKVLQLKNTRESNYAFMDYDFAQEHGFSLNDYEVVYEGELNLSRKMDIFDILETLFTKFNIDRPEDFHGHSMSVSDLVELEGELYYVDSVAFQKVSKNA